MITTTFNWILDNLLEIFGVISGIIYVFLEIKQDVRLWPVGFVTAGVYMWVFFGGKLYADACLQCYYLVISVLGWRWWIRSNRPTKTTPDSSATNKKDQLRVTHIKKGTAIVLAIVFATSFVAVWIVLDRLTDSPVPMADAFVSTLSAIATWMLARKYIEHWYLWILIDFVAAILFYERGLYPTIVLYLVYGVMAFVGLKEWRKSMATAF